MGVRPRGEVWVGVRAGVVSLVLLGISLEDLRGVVRLVGGR